MSLSPWLAGTRFVRRLVRKGGQVPASAQNREHLAETSTGTETSPAPVRPAEFGVEQEIRSVLGDVTAAPRRQPVRLEIAVQPRLTLRADRAVFHQVLEELVGHACSQALVGRVLVTASRIGEWVQVSVSDDAVGSDERAREDALRPIERLIARQDGVLEITSWPDQGTTVLMRWPAGRSAETAQGRAPLSAREWVSTG